MFGCGLYVIEAHDLKAIFFAIVQNLQDKLWRAFFLDPLKWWDHKSNKVLTINPIIIHMSMDEPLVFLASILLLFFLVIILPRSNLWKKYFHLFCLNMIIVVG
jgi:hypothetical protein